MAGRSPEFMRSIAAKGGEATKRKYAADGTSYSTLAASGGRAARGHQTKIAKKPVKPKPVAEAPKPAPKPTPAPPSRPTRPATALSTIDAMLAKL